MDAELRQKFLTPITLRLAQWGYDIIKWPPLTCAYDNQYQSPFFIIGCGRSGTTLLRSVLQSHPDLHIPPESMGRLPNCVKKYYRYGGLDWDDMVNVILGEFSSFETFYLWEISVEDVRQELLKTEKKNQCLQNIIHTIYSHHLNRHKKGALRWGDKSPFNTLRLNWIDKLFPQAQYIEIIRDGRDVVSSFIKSGLINDHKAAAERWRKSLENVEKLKKSINADRFTTIYYEDLVNQPTMVAQKLCSFLNIDYKTDLINQRETDLQDDDLPHMASVQKPVTTSSVGKWKERLSGKQKIYIRRSLSDLLHKHGYKT